MQFLYYTSGAQYLTYLETKGILIYKVFVPSDLETAKHLGAQLLMVMMSGKQLGAAIQLWVWPRRPDCSLFKTVSVKRHV